MLSGRPTNPTPLLTMRDLHGHRYTLVAFPDGSYAILRNGEPLENCRWSAFELDTCIRHLMTLTTANRDLHA